MAADEEPPDLVRSRARRTARRRQVRRRRLTGAGAVVVVAAVALAAALALRSGPSAPAADHATTGSRTQARGASTPRRAGAAGRSTSAACAGPFRREQAPILEYHVIAQAPPGAPFPLLYVSPARFAEQMDAVAAAGYHAVTLDQLWANWHDHLRLPCKPIVVSFDNGYETQFQFAAPVLARLGWVGVENLQLFGLDWANGGISHHEIRELVKDGWELDTQGWDHADLVTQTTSGLHLQIVAARRKLERWFHVPVNWFCYPSGQYDPAVIDALRAGGFRGSTTEYYGWAGPDDNPFALPRLEVHPTLDGAGLVSQIEAMRNDPPPGDQYIS
jgi:peptidoglycan/xylan/chitin deacetylase (PgdA/CDA1 family)